MFSLILPVTDPLGPHCCLDSYPPCLFTNAPVFFAIVKEVTPDKNTLGNIVDGVIPPTQHPRKPQCTGWALELLWKIFRS